MKSEATDQAGNLGDASAQFAQTHWTIVLAAADRCSPGAQEALEQLCRAYWYPPLRVSAKERFRSPEEFKKLTKWHGDKAQWVLDAWTNVWLSPAFASWSLESDLERVRCPVLAIHSELDEYGPVDFPRCIISRVKGPNELMILKGCGHVPHREQPDEVLQSVSSFMANWFHRHEKRGQG